MSPQVEDATVQMLRTRSREASANADIPTPRLLALLALALLACSDTPTGIRAIQFASSLGVEIETFTETRSGLFYKDIRTGEGGAAAGTGSFVNFFVQGWYADGIEFQPRRALNNVRVSAGELIPGMDEALLGMRAGGERMAVIPPGLAYGDGRVLVFRIEVTGVQ